MLPFLFVACFRVADPFHFSVDTTGGLVSPDTPEDSGCVGSDCGNGSGDILQNTHYLRIGEAGTDGPSYLEFESPSGGWLRPYAFMETSWSLSMKLPLGLKDPAEIGSEASPIEGWMLMRTQSMWLGINLQECELTYGYSGNYSEVFALENGMSEGCSSVSGTIAVGERLTISFEPLLSTEPASLQIAVLLDGTFLGHSNVDYPTSTGEPRLYIGGDLAAATLADIVAPALEFDQLMILPQKIGGEENVELSEVGTNSQLNDLKEGYVGHFFPLGEADVCPDISEFVDDFISGNLVDADCSNAFLPLQ